MKKIIGVLAILALVAAMLYWGNIFAAIAFAWGGFMWFMNELNTEGWREANASHKETIASLQDACAALKEQNDLIERYKKLCE